MSIVRHLKTVIKNAEDNIAAIQKACTHPDPARSEEPVKLTYYEREDDEYGLSSQTAHRENGKKILCGLCEKSWVENSEGDVVTEFTEGYY